MNKVMHVELTKLDSDEIIENVVSCCNFCNKKVQIDVDNYQTCLDLGHGKFFCSFCLRNHHTPKMKKHVLLLDFRGVIGFYFNYLHPEGKIWKSQIYEHIQKHAAIGLKNPAFSYDPESLLWFIDFTRVGQTIHKVFPETVKETVESIIDCFEMDRLVSGSAAPAYKKKYNEAIDLYYTRRQRPEDKRVLSPTLKDTVWRYQIDWESAKIFQINDLNDLRLSAVSPIINKELYSVDLEEAIMNKLSVNVKKRKAKGVEGWEGIVQIPGLAPTKLSSKDGITLFTKRKSLSGVARNLAKKLGLTIEFAENGKVNPKKEETLPAEITATCVENQ